MPTTVIDLFRRKLNVQWQKEGDEWAHYLFDALDQIIGLKAHTARTCPPSDDMPGSYVEYIPTHEKFRSRLRILLLKDGIYALVAMDGAPSDEDLAPWVAAINVATERLGENQPGFPWNAVIGPGPQSESSDQDLEAPCSIGPLHLHPGGILFSEYREPHVPSLYARSTFSSWPAIVDGVARGYKWDMASKFACRDLHRLCGILSVAWNRCWVLKHSPQPADHGSIEIPNQPWWMKPEENRIINEQQIPRTRVPIPDWAASAWELIERNRYLADALNAHYEGLLLQYQHPSFALIAFLGSIEGLGTSLYKVERCEACQSVKGSAERFRRTLRLVVSEQEAKQLGTAYTPRSQTAHVGRLHGMETVFGSMDFGFFTRLSEEPFEWGIVYRLRQASRKLLLNALTGELSLDF